MGRDRRIVEFRDSPLACFVQQLRNYTLHRRLPIAYGTLSWHQGGQVVSRIGLARDDLAAWEKWTSTARRYLDEAPENIDLLDLVDEYTTRVGAFNDWFGPTFVEGHLAAFDELKLLEAELQAANTG